MGGSRESSPLQNLACDNRLLSGKGLSQSAVLAECKFTGHKGKK